MRIAGYVVQAGGFNLAKHKHTNPIRLNDGMTIGSLAAETDDDYLFDCFVHYPPVDIAMKVDSHGSILTGRTGAGKCLTHNVSDGNHALARRRVMS
jgi:hypothetical protein